MENILYAILRTILAFILLMFITRLMGRKSISQMTFFDFSIAITIGSVAGNVGMGEKHAPITDVTVLICFGILGVISGIAHIKSFRVRKIMNSEPLVLIDKGEIIKKNMKKIRLTMNELTSLLREKDIFNIADVNYAIIENNGELSILPKVDKKALTHSDMQLHLKETGLTREIIIDGNILYENMDYANLTEKWLYDELAKKGISNVKDVFYASLDSTGNLYISLGNKQKESQGEYGIE